MRYGIFSRVSGEAAQVQQFRFLSPFPSSTDALAEITNSVRLSIRMKCGCVKTNWLFLNWEKLTQVKLGILS